MSNCYLDKASRAIECVNACAGIENPKDFIAQLTAVTKQRDELREALEKVFVAFKSIANVVSMPGAQQMIIETETLLTKTKESV